MKNSLAYKLIDEKIDHYIQLNRKKNEIHLKGWKGLLEEPRKREDMESQNKSEKDKHWRNSKGSSEGMYSIRGLLQGKH